MRNAKAWIRSVSLGLGCLLVVLGLLVAAHAQGVGTAAGIKGNVTDASGGILPKANVVAENAEKGIRRSAVTDSNGGYLITGLPPGSYNVSVEFPGFGSEIKEGLVVTVGQTAILDFHMKVASVKETVEVQSETPTVDTEKSSQSNTLTEVMIENLPIDRRDYLTFSLLAPGVSNSTRIADDTDYRVKQLPTSGLSFYGSNGRGNSVTVDAGEANDDEGGVRLTLGQDAVQEFQINRSNYGADMGGASGATINIVSKSGTDNVHGSAFGFFRNSAMDARDPFAFSSALAYDPTFSNFNTDSVGAPIKNSLSRQQYGGSIGFPIKKNKTFLFASFEGLRQNSQNSVPLLTDSSIFASPTIAGTNSFATSDPRYNQQQVLQQLYQLGSTTSVPCISGPNGAPTGVLLEAATCAQLLQDYLSINPKGNFISPQSSLVEGFLINQLEENGGVFPYDTREYLASGRLDHRFSEKDQFFLRYNFGHDLEESPDVQSLTGYSRGSSIHAYNHTLLASWFHLFSATTENEVRAQYSYNHTNVIPNEAAEVGLDVFGVANLGTNIFLPNYEILRRPEFADNLTLTKGHHTFRLGGVELLRGNHTQTNIFMPGRFETGPISAGLLSPCFEPSWVSVPPYGNPVGTNPCGLTQVPGQTDVPGANLSSLQAFSLGFPTIFEDGFGTPAYGVTRPFTAAYWQDTWALKSNFSLTYGVRYELDSQYLPLRTPWHNFAPRVSFAWDPFKDHKTVIRAGYGIFYGQVYDSIPGVDLALGVLNKNNSAVENTLPYASNEPGSQVKNLVATCGIQPVASQPAIVGAQTPLSPCTRRIGIYIDPIDISTLLSFGPTNDSSQFVFENLFAQGNPAFSGGVNNGGVIGCTTPLPGNYGCITPSDLTAASNGLFAPTNSGPVPGLSVVFSNQVNYESPYAQQAEFGFERQVARGFSVSLSYIYSHTVHLPVAIDTNLQNPGFVSVPLANGKTASYRDWNVYPQFDAFYQTTKTCNGNAGNCFYSPFIVQNNQYTSAASAIYNGGILEIKKQFNKTTTLLGNYTYSKAIDTTTDFNSDYGPQDNLNLGADRAVSNFDERQKVVVAGVLESPWRGVLSGFELSPIVSYNSGHPFNLLSGGPTNGDNHATDGRPIGAPRNSGLGPNYVDFDARVGWHRKLGERNTLEITAEGFNIPNRTNYASVNNEVGPLFAVSPQYGGAGSMTFNVHGIEPGTKLNGGTVSSSTPLAFTSDFPKREIQLGARLTF